MWPPVPSASEEYPMDQPTRKTIHLQTFDYQSNGAYFITICTERRNRLFWNNHAPVLNAAGEMVHYWVKELSNHFSGVFLDSYAIMDNHVHLILFFEYAEVDLNRVVGWFKTMTTNSYIQGVKKGTFPSFQKRIWQRSYYDHVIRNESDLREIRKYISENPQKLLISGLF